MAGVPEVQAQTQRQFGTNSIGCVGRMAGSVGLGVVLVYIRRDLK
jgi:hypothetical protein